MLDAFITEQGLFTIPPHIHGLKRHAGNIYCKITSVVLSTPPLPSRHMVISYSVHFIGSKGYTPEKRYWETYRIKVPGNKTQNVFFMKTEKRIDNIDVLVEDCKQHFIQSLRSGALFLERNSVKDSVFGRQLRGKYWRILTDNYNQYEYHLKLCRYTIQWKCVDVEDTLTKQYEEAQCYHEVNGKLVKATVSCPFSPSNHWLTVLANSIVAPFTVRRIVASFQSNRRNKS